MRPEGRARDSGLTSPWLAVDFRVGPTTPGQGQLIGTWSHVPNSSDPLDGCRLTASCSGVRSSIRCRLAAVLQALDHHGDLAELDGVADAQRPLSLADL